MLAYSSDELLVTSKSAKFVGDLLRDWQCYLSSCYNPEITKIPIVETWHAIAVAYEDDAVCFSFNFK